MNDSKTLTNTNQDRFAGRPIILDVRNLKVNFKVHGGTVYAVRDVSFKVRKGECLCIVGESGSGKSVTVQAMMGILPMPPAVIAGGQAFFNGKDLLQMSVSEKSELLGKEMSMIFQDPLTALNPTMTVGNQVSEMLYLHEKALNKEQRKKRVIELFDLVRMPEPTRRINQYPHELSGGLRQRVMIAIALACNPQVLIADEPTTALDVTIQAQILSLIKELATKLDMATILITHDLGVVAQMADRVAVMYAGKLAEEGLVDDVFYRSRHPYTVGLKNAMPKEGDAKDHPLEPIPGTPPDLFSPPRGCGFAARCRSAMAICHSEPSPLLEQGHARAACWLHNSQVSPEHRASSGITWLQEKSEA